MTLKVLRSGNRVDQHGGSLALARSLFSMAPEPWVDLSTGISPHSYPLLTADSTALSRLPDPAQADALRQVAADAYGAPDAGSVILSPGTQPLLPLIAGMVKPGKARILGPTYSEHARCTALAGHHTAEVADIHELESADIAVVVNPDNPTGRLMERGDLKSLAATVTASGGLLVVDEAFMDVTPGGFSLAGDVQGANIIVLRSFGKFFGLAGIRLSFAIAPQPFADYLSAALGPWPVSATALQYGVTALADRDWRSAMRKRLASEAVALQRLLSGCGLELAGGTDLFQLAAVADADGLFRHLGEAGILVRRFAEHPNHLRVGLPGSVNEWERLKTGLESWPGSIGP